MLGFSDCNKGCEERFNTVLKGSGTGLVKTQPGEGCFSPPTGPGSESTAEIVTDRYHIAVRVCGCYVYGFINKHESFAETIASDVASDGHNFIYAFIIECKRVFFGGGVKELFMGQHALKLLDYVMQLVRV